MTTTDSTTTTPNPIKVEHSTVVTAVHAASTTAVDRATSAVKPASVATTLTEDKPVAAIPTSATTTTTDKVNGNLKTAASTTPSTTTTTTTSAVAGKVPSPILTQGTGVRVPCPVQTSSASSKVAIVSSSANTVAATAAANSNVKIVAAPLKPDVQVQAVSRPVAMATTTSTTATTTAAATVATNTATSTRPSNISVAAPSTIRVQVPNPVSAPIPSTSTATTTTAAAASVPTPVPVQIPSSIGAVASTTIVAPSTTTTTTNKIAPTITHVTHHPAKATTVYSAPTSTPTTTTPSTHMATATVKTVPVAVAQPIHVNKAMTTRKMNQRHVNTTTNTTTTVSPVPSSTTSTRSSKSTPKKKKHKVPMTTSSNSGSNNTSASENTGRWTTEEHRLFLQGLEQHGKGWKKIASLIKSRTVVQIRTHAQKYFQKMAKSRQNGETTEETVASHDGNHATSHSIHHGSKRKKNGNKRKAIASVVHSAVKERKTKKKKTAASTGTSSTVAAPVESQVQAKAEPEGFPVSMVSTALAPYVYPPVEHDGNGTVVTAETTVPSITTAHGTISGAALEESLFRFLTPMPNDYVNDVARQAGANSITLPSGNPNKTALDGEVSPSGVIDFPSDWAWSTEPPSWYAKGADVDELLNEADALDWLADTGDLQEAYTPPDPTKMTSEPSLMSLVENPSTTTVVPAATNEAKNEPIHKEHVAIKTEEVAAPIPVLETSNNMASISSNGNMPLLPSMFDSGNHLSSLKKESSVNEHLASSASLFAAATEGTDAVVDADNFKLLDEHFEDEQAFVTALLDHPNDSSANLNHLGAGDNNHQ